MKKNNWKKWLKFFGVFAVVFLLINLGINLWLKYKLPDYIKNNSNYKVTYGTLNVDIITGTIIADDIIINTNNSRNTEIINLDGSLQQLKISRFNLYSALFNKEINSDDLLLKNPILKIRLPKPLVRKEGKKRNPVNFSNISIEKGDIQIYKYTEDLYLSVKQLDVSVENLQMTEESVERKLPVVFDTYSISGSDFILKPDALYTLTIDRIFTKDGRMNVQNLHLGTEKTLSDLRLTPQQNPKVYTIDIKEATFQDIDIRDQKFKLSQAKLIQPQIIFYDLSAYSTTKEKSTSILGVDLGDVQIQEGTFKHLKADSTQVGNAENIYIAIKKLAYNQNTVKNIIPVNFEDYQFSAKNVAFEMGTQHISSELIKLDRKTFQLKNVRGKHTATPSSEFSLQNFIADFERLGVVDGKLSLGIKKVLVDKLQGEMYLAKNTLSAKKIDFSQWAFPITIADINVRNSSIGLRNDKGSWMFAQLNTTIAAINVSHQSKTNTLDFDLGKYKLAASTIKNESKFYTMSMKNLQVDNNQLRMTSIALKPKYSRAQFIKMIPTERDLYDIEVKNVIADGQWSLLGKNKQIAVKNLMLDGINANIFRSKTPADDPKVKPLYSKLLRKVSIPMHIASTQVKNSTLVYEEDTPTSSGPGKLTFGNFNMHISNLNSAKMTTTPTLVKAKINCAFMNASPMHVLWTFDTKNQSDQFSIAGEIDQLPATRVNAFVKPYLNVSLTGEIQKLTFDFKGNDNSIGGLFKLKHKDLKVAILNKETKKKKGLLSSVANIFIKSDSGDYPEKVEITEIQREKTKSFFNMFWKGIESGLKISLIGNLDTKVNNTVSTVKETAKTVKKTANKVVEKVDEVVAPKEPEAKKEGLLNRVFKKKDK